MGRRLHRIGIALTALSLLAAACASETADDTSPTSSSSATTPTTTPTTTTAAADTTTTSTTTTTVATTTTFPYPFRPEGPRDYPEPLTDDPNVNGSGCTPTADELPDGVWFGHLQKADGELIDLAASTLHIIIHCIQITHGGQAIGIDQNPGPDYRIEVGSPGTAYGLHEHGGEYTTYTLSEWVQQSSCRQRACPIWVYVNDSAVTHVIELDLPFRPDDSSGVSETPLTLPERDPIQSSMPDDPLGLWVDFRGLDQARTGPQGEFSREGTAMPGIAVGPDRILLATNDTVALLSKTGTFIAIENATRMFNPVNAGPSQATWGQGSAYQRAHYDAGTERFWFLASGRMVGTDADGQQRVGFRDGEPCVLGECVAQVFLAVSMDSTPETLTAEDWHLYGLDWTMDNDTVTRNFSGNATISIGPDVTVIAGGSTNYPTPADVGYEPRPDAPAPPAEEAYGKARVLSTADLLAGRGPEWVDLIEPLATNTSRSVTSRFGSVIDTTGSDARFLVSVRSDGCTIDVWRVEGSSSGAALTRADTGFSEPCTTSAGINAPQLSGPPLETAGSSSLNFEAPLVLAGGSIWGARVVRAIDGPRSAIHWFELDVGSWPELDVVQSGIYQETGHWFHHPALTVDPDGNMAMVFRDAAADQLPNLVYTGRLADDPVGDLREKQTLRAGDAPFDFDRAGYYSAATTDPADGSMWLFGQFSLADLQWGTWVGRVWPMGF